MLKHLDLGVLIFLNRCLCLQSSSCRDIDILHAILCQTFCTRLAFYRLICSLHVPNWVLRVAPVLTQHLRVNPISIEKPTKSCLQLCYRSIFGHLFNLAACLTFPPRSNKASKNELPISDTLIFFSFVQCRKPPTSTPFYFNFFFLATVKPSGNQGIFWTFLDSPRHVPSMESYMWLSVSGFVHLACFPGSLVLSIAILGYFVCRSHITVLLIQHLRATSLVCLDCQGNCCLYAVFFFAV